MNIIAFTGLAGCGKSLAAQNLVRLGYERRSFAQPIKDMIATCWPQCREKSHNYPEFGGHTLRHAYQTLGTEWGRHMMYGDIWVDYLINSMCLGRNYVVDDLRYDNEALALKKCDAYIVEIRRDGLEKMAHTSENGVDPKFVDGVIHNNGTTEELIEKINRLRLEFEAWNYQGPQKEGKWS